MIRKITEHHAKEIHKIDFNRPQIIKKSPNTIIAETDGSMVPIVEIDEDKAKAHNDKRKKRVLKYREARLSMACKFGSTERIFDATFDNVNKVGKNLKACALRVGFNDKTKVHCVGDGALWIANQIEEQFGANGYFLVDFYHLCEYLSPDASAAGKGKKWVKE